MSQPRATKVLVIGYVWPEPRSSAASGHVMQILDTFLQQGWDITFSSPAGTGEHRADLTALGIREVPIELNNSSFDTFISELMPDIVLFDQFMIEEQFGWRVEKHCPDALRVLEQVTASLQTQVTADANLGMANATPYLDLFGRVVVGWIWLRQALLASRALGSGAGDSDADFYQGKLQAAHYYMTWELASLESQGRLLTEANHVAYYMQDRWF